MVNKQTVGIEGMMARNRNIRNMSVIAHVDHGKSTLTDCLLIHCSIANKEAFGKRAMDTRKDEQERGITIKSTAISMKYKTNLDLLKAYCDKDDFEDREFLINLIDSPGHVDFSSEVTAALRVTDGALVVIDVTEGICVQTETVLRQAIDERVKPTLVLNKMDRHLFEKMTSPDELYSSLTTLIEEVNNKIESIVGERKYNFKLSPGFNDVSFCSGYYGWGFTLSKFARFYLKSKQTGDEYDYEKEKRFASCLFDSNKYCDFEGQFPEKYSFKKFKGQIPEGKKTPFLQLVLEPIYKMISLCEDEKYDEVKAFLKQYGVDLSDVDLTICKTVKNAFNTLAKKWIPASESVLEQIVTKLPNPKKSQIDRASILYTGPTNDECYKAIAKCSTDDDAPVVMYVSKMVPVGTAGFVAFGRIFSGVLKDNMKVYVQTPDYDPNDENSSHRYQKTVTRIHVCMGKRIESISECPAGNIVAISGIDATLKKTGTITTCENAYNIKTMKFSVAPIVKVAVIPKEKKDLNKFHEGLDKLGKSDPLCVIEFNEQGQAIVGCAGELHLEIILSDLSDFANCKFKVEPPQCSYYEGISAPVEKIRMTKSSNKHNRISMTAECLDSEIIDNLYKVNHKDPKERVRLFKEHLNVSGEWVKKIMSLCPEEEPLNMLVDETKGIQYLNEVKDHINNGMKQGTSYGPILGEKVRGVRFNLKDVVLHADSIHRGANQILNPVERLCRGLILDGSPVIYEPIFSLNLSVVKTYGMACETIIKKRRGLILDTYQEGDSHKIEATIPVVASFGMNKELREASKGYAYINLSLSHFDVCPGSLDKPESVMGTIVQNVRDYKKINTKLESSAYFDTL